LGEQGDFIRAKMRREKTLKPKGRQRVAIAFTPEQKNAMLEEAKRLRSLNPFDRAANYGPAQFDRRSLLTISHLWDFQLRRKVQSTCTLPVETRRTRKRAPNRAIPAAEAIDGRRKGGGPPEVPPVEATVVKNSGPVSTKVPTLDRVN
jgi:hypothetical protein